MIGSNGKADNCWTEFILCTGQELLFLSLDPSDVSQRAGPSHDPGKWQKEQRRTVQCRQHASPRKLGRWSSTLLHVVAKEAVVGWPRARGAKDKLRLTA